MTDPFDDKGIHLKGFPDSALLDIARNGSAQRDYRLTAVEILKTRKSPRITHPDIQDLVRELEIELDGIVFENPAPSGALKASVTTRTMAEDVEFIDNGVPEPEVIPTDVPPTEPEIVPTEPKPRRTRKPKEPVDDPQPE
jgi:hypothetical protein